MKITPYIFLFLVVSTFLSAQEKEIKQTSPKITFVELGSVKCVPCIQMQPIMKSVEQKYGEQIK
ncbi:MAG: hypothetical protein WBH40_18020, partial [Ignavibacteriaceae bacterium]